MILAPATAGISTFLSFGAKSVQPEILEKMLIGRQKTADLLEQYVREIVTNGVNHQVFMVGPRGSGKTHSLRVLYHRVADLVQSRQVVVAYFAEEEYGITGYLDFVIRILNAFLRWYAADKTILETQLDILRETHPNRQESVAERIISEYVGDKPLLILSENFDNVLEALGKQGQAKLRAWLYRHNRISIIATAQTTSPDLGREDRPFYGFFSTIYLKKLSYEDSLALLIALAETEPNPTRMLEHLAGKGKAQMRAIHELVKGNHRLLVTFYEFLKADTLADLSVIFMKTMNDLKPYYETFIRYLPAQQQKILHYLALAKIPQKGTDIAKNCFIATASLTKQLSELQRRHLIDALPDPTDKRNKLYDVSEPLLRIAIEIGEQREGITSLFIDFLALYYSHDEIKSQKARFEDLYLNEVEPIKKQKLGWEIEARDQALKLRMELRVDRKESTEEVVQLTWSATHLFEQGKHNKALATFKKALKIRPDFEWTWYGLGRVYEQLGKIVQAIEAYSFCVKINSENELAWYNLGGVYKAEKEFEKAIQAYDKAIQINPLKENYWHDIGLTFYGQENFAKAIEAFNKAVSIDSNYEWAWYGLGMSYNQQGHHNQAIQAYLRVVKIDSQNELAWGNLGRIYFDQGSFDLAIEPYQKAIDIQANDEWIWLELGISYDELSYYDKAIQAFTKAGSIKPDFRWAWVKLGDVYAAQGDHRQAIKSYTKAVEIDLTDDYAVECMTQEIVELLIEQTATKDELIELKDLLHEVPRFELAYEYINIYRRVIFANDEKALYELPKEQRIFFEREILKRSTE